MSQHLSANLDFITSFVETCHAQGFNEKQAAELLNNYAKNEFYLTDKDFRENLDTELQKSASTVPKALFNLFKALGSSAIKRPGLSVPVLSGAATGALAPEGILPEGYGGSALTGGILGGLLGLAGTRGKGLGTALKNIGKAVTGGGVLRTGAGQGFKLLTHPKLLMGAGKGALGGLAAAGAKDLSDIISNRLPNISPNSGIPSYMQEGYSSGADSPALSDINLYDTTGDIRDQALRSMGGSSGYGGSSFLNSLKENKQQLLDLDNRITALQSSLREATNPAAYGQRSAIQAQIDNLKMQRNSLNQGIIQAENKFYNDTTNIINQANKREDLANKGLSGAQTEFENIMKRKALEQQGGVSGYLMKLYNRLAGTEGRLGELDPMYRGYQSELERARQLRNLGINNILE
jgi:hypothetical protein